MGEKTLQGLVHQLRGAEDQVSKSGLRALNSDSGETFQFFQSWALGLTYAYTAPDVLNICCIIQFQLARSQTGIHVLG